MSDTTAVEEGISSLLHDLDALGFWLGDYHTSSHEPVLLKVQDIVAGLQSLRASRNSVKDLSIPLPLLKHIAQPKNNNPDVYLQKQLQAVVSGRRLAASQSTTIQVMRHTVEDAKMQDDD